MKRVFLAMVIAMSVFSSMNADETTKYEINGITIKAVTKTSQAPTLTKYEFEDSKGNKYPIYISSNGKAFIVRKSNKTGKEYKQYLDISISEKLAKEYGITIKK